MPTRLHEVVRRLRTIGETRTDAALLGDFLRRADQDAFAELIRRHGPAVLGVCRRFLGNTPDAADAFQATFLVLIRRARHNDWRESLGPWLFGVALRVARKARTMRNRRRTLEREVTAMTPEPAAAGDEPDDLAIVLDEELAALPEMVRKPLVLCELQGLSRRDAARELGLAEGTLSSRLARGRRMLRERLERRGISPSTLSLAVAIPAELVAATTRHAVAALTRASASVPASILLLTDGAVKAMVVKWRLAFSMVAVCLGLTGWGAWWSSSNNAALAADPPTKPAPQKAARTPEVIATIFGNEAVTRDDFAEHLIRKYGRQELNAFVNGRVIRRAFEKRGLTLAQEDIQTAVEQRCKELNTTVERLEQDLVLRDRTTLADWIDADIVPALMLRRMYPVKPTPPTDAELRQAYQAKYGEKVQCQLLFWPKELEASARKVHDLIGGTTAGFDRYTSGTGDLQLALHRGRYPHLYQREIPLTPELGARSKPHEIAVKLRVGELSPLVETPDGFHLIKCVGTVPARTTWSFEEVKAELLAEILRKRTDEERSKQFRALRQEAITKVHLTFPEPTVMKK